MPKKQGFLKNKKTRRSRVNLVHSLMSEESKIDDLANAKKLIESVGKFFYEDNEFASTFETFVNDNASIIDDDEIEKTGVLKVEYTSLYNDFKELFETQIEKFIVGELNSTIEEFYDALEASVAKDPEGEDAIFGQIMLATADFDVFMMMMREAAQSQKRK